MVPSPQLQWLAVTAHTEGLRRHAASRDARRAHAQALRTGGGDLADRRIMIRAGRADDACALVRLAELDSAELPPKPLLVAEIDGELRAALSLRSGALIADPFHPTAAAVELLRLRAAQLEGVSRSRLHGRLRHLVARLTATDPDTAKEAT